jgi:hypothetical protein
LFGPESGVDADVVIYNRNRLLPHDVEASAAQFIGQHRIVNGFQQTRPESGMYAESGVHNFLCNRFERFRKRFVTV